MTDSKHDAFDDKVGAYDMRVASEAVMFVF